MVQVSYIQHGHINVHMHSPVTHTGIPTYQCTLRLSCKTMMNTIWRNCFSCEKLEELLNPGLCLWVNRLNVLVLFVNDCYLSNEEEETLFKLYNTG